MSQIYAAVGSITTATRLSKELFARGIKNTVTHTPGSGRGGCSYSVKLDEAYRKEITELAGRYKIKKIIDPDSDGLYDIS